MFIKQLTANHNFALILAIITGFFFVPVAEFIQQLIIPILMIAMTLSISNSNIREILTPSKIIKPSIMILLFNFLALGSINIGLGYLFSDDTFIKAGFVILASAPPSLAIPAFSHNLKGNVNFAFVGTTFGYIASLAIMPLVVVVFLAGQYEPNQLLVLLFQLIVIPLFLSQLYRGTKLIRITQKYHGRIINWCIALVCFSLIGINRELIVNSPQDIFIPAVIAFLSIFVFGEIIHRICIKLSLSYEDTINYILFGTMKKWAGASVIALTLFGPKAAIPAVLGIIFGFLYYFWLGIKFNYLGKKIY